MTANPTTTEARNKPDAVWTRQTRLALLAVGLLASGCAGMGPAASTAATPSATLPLRTAWFEGKRVHYVTTDVSDAAVAKAKGANFVPRLRDLLQKPGAKALLERVYSVVDSKQPTVFPSAPAPLGAANRDAAYTPLWRLVEVRWQAGRSAVELKSEESILQAEERGDVRLTVNDVVLNCPIFAVEGAGALLGSGAAP